MSVTVQDLLSLPSLRDSEVIAGKSGLSRIVASVSVLEYADPTFLQDELFNNNEFYGSEIVITAFANIKDDVEAQCANIRRLANVGEVGLILYYVGIFMPRVDKRLIKLADELDFTLICMPKNRMDFRYSEVICEIMEAIFRDQDTGTSLVTEILERVSRLPAHQRTIDTVLKMLSDRIKTSVILTDVSNNVLNIAAWPRTFAESIAEELKKLPPMAPTSGELLKFSKESPFYLYRFSIGSGQSVSMNLLLLRDGGELSQNVTRQAVELVRLAVNISGGSIMLPLP